MKDIRFHVSLYVIVPVIFAGYATLCAILSYRLTLYCTKHALSLGEPIFWAISIFAGVGFGCGWLVVWAILKPVRAFIRDARAAMAETAPLEDKQPEQPHEWERFFKQVTSVLSMVDAKTLFPDIIAESKAMRAVLSQVTKVAPTDATVLLTGESGSGKEMIATAIYRQSRRKDKPFVKLNCVAIPEGLLESELFGHEKGAFTGATDRKIGKFELANGGTIFLDEIGDMPSETQAKILRVLQEREFERVGGTKTIQVDVRFIAATHRDLPTRVAEGTFREDLFFRLNVFSLKLPPLRERREDIPVIVEHFARTAPRPVTVSPMSMQVLMGPHSWNGNVRELRNVIERASVVSDDGIIEPRHLPEEILNKGGLPMAAVLPHADAGHSESLSAEAGGRPCLDDQLAKIEKSLILEALRQSGGVQKNAALLLGIKERSLWHRIRKYDIDAKSLKEGS